MLVLGRREGQWLEIVHSASGDVLRVRTYDIVADAEGGPTLDMAFHDPARNFAIERDERLSTRSGRTAKLDRGVMPSPVLKTGAGTAR